MGRDSDENRTFSGILRLNLTKNHLLANLMAENYSYLIFSPQLTHDSFSLYIA